MEIDRQISSIKAILIARGVDAGVVQTIVKNCRRDGQTDDRILRELVGALYDGLAYGNWPQRVGGECE